MVSSVPTIVFCEPVVAQRVNAIGVWASAPCSMKAPVISRSLATPIRNTFVPGALANCA